MEYRNPACWHAEGKPLDVLVLNAGVQYSGDNAIRRTDDGFEITVGTNHLGHFLLTNLLLPDMEAAGTAAGAAAGGAAPRIVVTASEVHDPASPGGAVGPGAGLGGLSGLDASGADFEMLDGSEYNADKARGAERVGAFLFTSTFIVIIYSHPAFIHPSFYIPLYLSLLYHTTRSTVL